MSRICELTGLKKTIGHNVPVERSQTGVRTLRTYEPNIQTITFLSDTLGKVSLKVAVKTIRSIEHNGGFDKFLLKQRASELTVTGRKLKKQVIAKLTEKGAMPKFEPAKRRAPKVSPKRAAAAAKKTGEAKPAKKSATKAAAPKKKPAAKK